VLVLGLVLLAPTLALTVAVAVAGAGAGCCSAASASAPALPAEDREARLAALVSCSLKKVWDRKMAKATPSGFVGYCLLATSRRKAWNCAKSKPSAGQPARLLSSTCIVREPDLRRGEVKGARSAWHAAQWVGGGEGVCGRVRVACQRQSQASGLRGSLGRALGASRTNLLVGQHLAR
jgi:hypothetical protein